MAGYRFGMGYTTKNHNASAFGAVSKPAKEKIPSLCLDKCGHSKYPFSLVQEIRSKHETGGYTYAELSRAYGISKNVILLWCQYLQRVHA